nr:MAG TPA: hypothetical protein [Caudoviricetes sp.]
MVGCFCYVLLYSNPKTRLKGGVLNKIAIA